MSAIPEDWIKRYVDQLIEAAHSFGPGAMRDATTVRAEHAMDLVKAYRESQQPRTGADPC